MIEAALSGNVPGGGYDVGHRDNGLDGDSLPPWEVIVVGAGQAGLAMGRELDRRGLSFLIVDAAEGPGATWRGRWDSLRLFTPAACDSLPDFPFPAPPDHLPGKDEVADYLARYRDNFDLPVRWRTPVRRLTMCEPAATSAAYALRTPTETLTARQVVLATGPFQRGWVPPVADRLGDDVYQLHVSDYRGPDQLPEGPALVAGAGNSGVQIADELARYGPTTLAVGGRHPYLPIRLAGRSVFRWLEHLGLLRIRRDSPLGVLLRRRREVMVGDRPRRLRQRHGIRLAGRVDACGSGVVRTRDGAMHRPRSVIWATGYVPDFSWVQLPVLTDDGWVRQRGGRSELPGLYTLGLPWQATNGSALLVGVGRDAARLAADIDRYARASIIAT